MIKKIDFKKNATQIVAGGLLVGVSFLQLFAVTSSVVRHFSPSSDSNQVMAASKDFISSSNDQNSQEFVPTHITIQSADIDLAVVPQSLNNGTWPVADGVANYAVETDKVNKQKGNVGIFGHDLPNAFTRIKTLKLGDTIELSGQGKRAYYQVAVSQVYTPQSVDLFYSTQTPTLTLVTCDGIFSEQRFIVRAVLIRYEDPK